MAVENLQVDKRKNLDLTKLKELGGPFTTADDVDKYMVTNISDREKVRCLYLEVRYQRDACVSLPKNSDIFRLKRQYQVLSPEEYSTNLKIYLSKIECINTATI